MKLSLLIPVILAASAHGVLAAPPSVATPAMPAPQPGPAPAAGASASRVVTEHWKSKALGVDKAVVVYLPRGYDSQPKTHWPVFYYLHGLGGTENDWTHGMHIDQVADKLNVAAIIVMPDGDDGFYINSDSKIDYDKCMKDGTGLFAPAQQPHDATCVHQRQYGSYITDDLVAWTDGKYRTIAKKDGRAIAGLSMGGFGAMVHGILDHKLFAAAASHSGAIELMYTGPHPFVAGKADLLTDPSKFGPAAGRIGTWIHELFGDNLATWKAYDFVNLMDTSGAAFSDVALYFDCGTEDDFALQDNLQYLHEKLVAHKIKHEYFLGPGKHDVAFWSQRVPYSLGFLRDHTAKPQ